MTSPFRSAPTPSRSQGSSRKSGKGSVESKENREDILPCTPSRPLSRASMPSPGQPPASPNSLLHLCRTPRDAVKTNGSTQSPFREWATGALDCLDNEMISPGNAVCGSLLSPSYTGMPVKIENSPLQSSTTEVPSVPSSLSEPSSASFSLSPNREFRQEIVTKMKAEVHSTSFQDANHDQKTPQQHAQNPRRYRLSMCELFAFELVNDQVHVVGCDINPGSSNSSTRKKRYAGIPVTPAVLMAMESQDRGIANQSDARKRVCSCKKSRCLKLYCECFSAGVMCSGCKCMDCANDGDHEEERLQAVDAIKMRNQNAFAPKIVDEHEQLKGSMHARGCRCKKSHCLKKYCECFQAGVHCKDKCKCEECKNKPDFDATPRERELGRGALGLSSSSPDSLSSGSGKRLPRSTLYSPEPNKKPRVLDFNVMATPKLPEPNLAEQDSDGYNSDSGSVHGGPDFGSIAAFGSPGVFLRMPAA